MLNVMCRILSAFSYHNLLQLPYLFLKGHKITQPEASHHDTCIHKQTTVLNLFRREENVLARLAGFITDIMIQIAQGKDSKLPVKFIKDNKQKYYIQHMLTIIT